MKDYSEFIISNEQIIQAYLEGFGSVARLVHEQSAKLITYMETQTERLAKTEKDVKELRHEIAELEARLVRLVNTIMNIGDALIRNEDEVIH